MLEGKVAIVTGSSFGLGKAIAFKLAEQKAKVALLARSEKELAQVKQEILSKGGVAEYFVCDLTQHEKIPQVYKDIESKLGSPDILVNNAGTWWTGKFEDQTPENIKMLFGVNTLGTIFMTQEALKIMKSRNSGQILNVMSIAGTDISGDYSVYTTTKHALRGFTESVRGELERAGSQVKITGLYPAGIDTHLFEATGFNQGINKKWLMKPEDVADVVVFMLSTPQDIILNHVEIRKLA